MPREREVPGTSHFSIVDRNGNAVAMTTSVENAFGSRLMVDGAESQLHVDDDPDSVTYEWYVGPKVVVQ